jgi:hypothetical protein
MKYTSVRIGILLVFCCAVCFAQEFKATYTPDNLAIDGILDEASWQTGNLITSFWQHFPFDSSLAVGKTEVRILYNDQYIYVGAKMYTRDPDYKYVTPSLRRDFRGAANDAFTITFDTFIDQTNAFQFGINPYGVQREALISNGGSNGGDLSLNWDNKWFSEATMHDGYWIAEMAIPFKTLRFKTNQDHWRLKIYRLNSELSERSVWPATPRNYEIFSLAYTGKLFWDKPLQYPGSNISIIPYAAGGVSRNFLENESLKKNQDIGLDAKIALGPALNLDLTINPDFSQVEVDQQVTNLDRFEIFFPERRQFFLENADLFSDFGTNGIRPFFSRRIGIARDTATGQNLQNAIYGGARLTGKIDNNWRIGLLSMQASRDKSIQLPSTNYSVFTVQRKVGTRSNLGLIVVNKQAFQDSIQGDFTTSPTLYNRLIGLDFNLASPDNTWNGKLFYHRSFDNAKLDSAYATGFNISYNKPALSVNYLVRNIGANYNPEVGFVRRKDYLQTASTIQYSFYPASSFIQRHGPGFDFDVLGNDQYGLLDWDVNLLYSIDFLNTSSFNLRLRKQYTYLFNSFDPSGSGGLQLEAGTAFHNYQVIANYRSDQRRKFFFSLSTRSGEYFNGERLNLDGSMSYRFQPYAVISVDFTVNRIELPKPYSNADLLLIGPKIDLTFSRNVFWTTFIQYNNQINNLNINSRLQWRFKPVSDLFLVYTDNYATGDYIDGEGRVFYRGQPKLRAIVLKISYWLNI